MDIPEGYVLVPMEVYKLLVQPNSSMPSVMIDLEQAERDGVISPAFARQVSDEVERLRAQLVEARSIIDDLRFHDLSGRADKFMDPKLTEVRSGRCSE